MERIKKTCLLMGAAANRAFSSRANIIFILGVMPAAIVLSLLLLGNKSFWLDEAFSYTIARMDWPSFWHTLFYYEANQGLYYFLLHLWINLGQSEAVIRSLSVIFALCAVVMIYIFGTRLFGSRAGLIAALLTTVNAFFIAYAQESRSYMLTLLLTTISSYFFIRAIEKSGWKSWGVYILLSALGIYAHLYVVFVIIAQFVSLVFLPKREIPWKNALISGVILTILFVPMGLFVLTRDIGQISWVSTPRIWDIVRVFNLLSGQGGPVLMAAYFIPAVIGVIFAVRIYFRQKMSLYLWRYVFLLCWLFIPIILSFLFSFIKPIFVTRYFIIFLPPLIFIVAEGLGHFKKRWLMPAMGVLVLLSSVSLWNWYTGSQSENYFQKEDWRGATSYVISSEAPGDAIVFFHPVLQLPYDYYRSRFKATSNAPVVVSYLSVPPESLTLYGLPEGVSFDMVFPEPETNVLDRLSSYERVWLVLGHTFSKTQSAQSQELLDIFQEKYDIIEKNEYYLDTRVYLLNAR